MVVQAFVQLVPPLFWAASVFLAWVGYGSAAARWAGHDAGLGLRAGWGMAVVVLLGGVLNATRQCGPVTLGGITVVGVGLAVPYLARRWRGRAVPWAATLPWAVVVAYGAFVVVGSLALHGTSLNMFDDDTLYCVLPKKMLEAGAAIDPLSQRRLSTFGGYAFLQAQLDVVAHGDHPFLLDRALGSVLTILLVLGRGARTTAGRWADAAVAVGCWLYPIPSANTMSAWTTTAMALTFLRSVLAAQDADAGAAGRRRLALAAAAATALATFRVNTMPLAPLTLAAWFAGRLWHRPDAWRAVAADAGVMLAVGGVGLLPWCEALHQACGSYLYPLMRGNERPGVLVASQSDVVLRAGAAGWAIATPPFLVLLPAVGLAAWLRQWTAVWLAVAAVVTAWMTAYAWPVALPQDYARYGVPLLLAGALYAVNLALRAPRLVRQPGLVAVVAAYFGTVVFLTDASPLPRQADDARQALTRRGPFYPPALRRAYADLQHAVPPGATIAAMLDTPVLLDFGRNPVDCIDLPTRAQKRGQWPLFQGPDALRAFLADQDVDYVAFRDFDRNDRLYSARMWQATGDRANARLMFDTMYGMYGMARPPALVYDRDGYRVVRVR